MRTRAKRERERGGGGGGEEERERERETDRQRQTETDREGRRGGGGGGGEPESAILRLNHNQTSVLGKNNRCNIPSVAPLDMGINSGTNRRRMSDPAVKVKQYYLSHPTNHVFPGDMFVQFVTFMIQVV